jgi:hypothetical protein
MSAIDLYWLPLGAGGHSVRLNGLVFEAIAARLHHRGRADLYHSALEVHVPEGRFVIEQAPAWGTSGERSVVAEGPVGIRAAGRFRLFRYEVRRWREGAILDLAEAVESPQRLSDDTERAAAAARAGATNADARVGPRRIAHRRDVELELVHFLAARSKRTRRIGNSPSDWRTGARLARWGGGRATPAARADF